MFLKFWLIAAYTFLKEGSHKKNSVIILVPEYSHSEEHEHSQSVHVLRGLSSGISICMFRLHRVLHRTNEKNLSHFQKHWEERVIVKRWKKGSCFMVNLRDSSGHRNRRQKILMKWKFCLSQCMFWTSFNPLVFPGEVTIWPSLELRWTSLARDLPREFNVAFHWLAMWP